MKLNSLLFSAALPATLVAVVAGVPALPALAFAATALVLTLAAHDYGVRRPSYDRKLTAARPSLRRPARLPLAA